MERYTELFRFSYSYFYNNGPLIIENAVIQKDSVDNQILAQIKLKNISNSTVVGCKVLIFAYEINGNSLIKIISHTYLDYYIKCGEVFGDRVPIFLPSNARRIGVEIDEVYFLDNTIWKRDSELLKIPEQIPLNKYFRDEKLVNEYRNVSGADVIFVPLEWNSLFLCSCGNKNMIGTNCSKCNCSYKELAANLNEDFLITSISKRRQLEKNKLEEELLTKKQKKKFLIKKCIVSIICMAGLGVCFLIYNYIIIPELKYQQAVELCSNGDYFAALNSFKLLGDYKDSPKYKTELKLIIQGQNEAKNIKKFHRELNYPNLMEVLECEELDSLRVLLGDSYSTQNENEIVFENCSIDTLVCDNITISYKNNSILKMTIHFIANEQNENDFMRDCVRVFDSIDDGVNVEVDEDGRLKVSYDYSSDNGNDITFISYDGYVDTITIIYH